ncbi:MAG: hypothetical protein ACI9SC_001691, partial [Gammaproteobacteria bacterium]
YFADREKLNSMLNAKVNTKESDRERLNQPGRACCRLNTYGGHANIALSLSLKSSAFQNKTTS